MSASTISPRPQQATVALAKQDRPRSARLKGLAGGQSFDRLGEWVERVSVARDGSIHRLARWMALQPNAHKRLAAADSATNLWRACEEANPDCFKKYRVLRMDRPSYFLPAGEVVFSVLENPTQIPDHPPTGVMLRHLEAMKAYPLAKFFFLRPVFAVDDAVRLLPPAELREEAAGDLRVARQIARMYGWTHRAEHWARRQAQRAGRAVLNTAGRAVDAVVSRFSPAAIPGGTVSVLAGRTLIGLAETAEAEGRLQDAIRYRASAAELRRRQDIDPILCFELPERPGELWFEAHWFDGADGRLYVHY